MSEATETQVVDSGETEQSTAQPKSKATKKSKREVTIKNMRNGKLFVCGRTLQEGEEYTLRPNDLKNAYQMKIVQRLRVMGLIKEI